MLGTSFGCFKMIFLYLWSQLFQLQQPCFTLIGKFAYIVCILQIEKANEFANMYKLNSPPHLGKNIKNYIIRDLYSVTLFRCGETEMVFSSVVTKFLSNLSRSVSSFLFTFVFSVSGFNSIYSLRRFLPCVCL